MPCPTCGHELPPSTTTCPHCAPQGAVPPPPVTYTTAASPSQSTSGMAIAALVLGLCSLFFSCITAVPGIIVGIIALVQIKKSKGALTGSGMAVGGIVTSGVLCVLSIALIGLITVPRFINAERRVRVSAQQANTHMLSNALEQFRTDVGVYPATLSDLTANSVAGLSPRTKAYPDFYADGFHGPYISVRNGNIPGTGLPANPGTPPTEADVAKHWTYIPGANGADYTLRPAP